MTRSLLAIDLLILGKNKNTYLLTSKIEDNAKYRNSIHGIAFKKSVYSK
jgi:hypothetical protein